MDIYLSKINTGIKKPKKTIVSFSPEEAAATLGSVLLFR